MSNTPLNGISFVITGELTKKRDEYITIIEDLGGRVVGEVSKRTNYLVEGPQKNKNVIVSIKHKKAVELGVPIITEGDLHTMIG